MNKYNEKTFESYVYLLIILFAILVGLTKIQYNQNEDMGLFLSEFALIANGHLPYKEIFEIKDPLFLLEGGLIYKLFGPQGIFLQDIFLLLICAPLSYRIGRKMELNPFFAALGSIIFILTVLESIKLNKKFCGLISKCK